MFEVDNSIDEAVMGFCSRIEVALLKDGSVRVVDDGRGIPVETHGAVGKSAVEVVLTRLHAGENLMERLIGSPEVCMEWEYQ